jgi:hypothetical protein
MNLANTVPVQILSNLPVILSHKAMYKHGLDLQDNDVPKAGRKSKKRKSNLLQYGM